MACTCPSGTTERSQIELRKYCSNGACTIGNTTYTKEYWSARQISCQNESGHISNYGCNVKLSCCS